MHLRAAIAARRKIYALSQMIAIHRSGKYAIEAKNNARAERSVRDRANRMDNHNSKTPRTSATENAPIPLSPIKLGTRLAGNSAAENKTAWRPVVRPSGWMTGHIGNPALQ